MLQLKPGMRFCPRPGGGRCADLKAAASCWPSIFWQGGSAELGPPYTDLPWSILPEQINDGEMTRIVAAPTRDPSPDPATWASSCAQVANKCFVNLDLETNGWSPGPDHCDDSPGSDINHHLDYLTFLRSCNPNALIGEYAVFPHYSTVAWHDDFTPAAQDFRCKAAADRGCAGAFANLVDYFGPTFYAPYNDLNGTWASKERHLTGMRCYMRDARIAAPNVPVYPFIWREALNSGTPSTLNDDFWQDILTAIRVLADGFFLYAYEPQESAPAEATDSWYQILLSNMNDMIALCAGIGLPARRLTHETPCACVPGETITATFTNGTQDFAAPLTLYQSAADPNVYGLGQDCSTPRAFVLEPHDFACHTTLHSETLIEITFDCGGSTATADVVANGNLVGRYNGGTSGSLAATVDVADPVSGCVSGSELVIAT